TGGIFFQFIVHIIILNFQIDFFSGPGGYKRTKVAWVVFEMSFWRAQKDKRNPGSDRNVLLEGSKGQKESG
ncbi:hypothetical protein AABM27_13355, partial [Heyndrickxia faecalis]